MRRARRATGLALALPLALAGLALPQAARAEVVAVGDGMFIARHTVTVDAPRSDVWEELVAPGQWWDSGHTYSGDAANLSLDPQAGGCFCEMVPAGAIGPLAGSIEHMRVIYAMPEVTLRMTGGLGPLQSEPVNAVMTITIETLPDGRARMAWEYAVGGYMRTPAATLAPLVDQVLGQQVARLAERLGGPVDPT